MEAFNSGDKKRVLPTWMTVEVPQKRAVPMKTPKRGTPAVPASAARLPAVKTVYCMSEAELVDVALGFLIEMRKQEEEPPPLAGADKPELSPTTCAESRSSTGRREGEDSGQGTLPRCLSPAPGPAGSGPACCTSPEEADDVLKYVREIFFS